MKGLLNSLIPTGHFIPSFSWIPWHSGMSLMWSGQSHAGATCIRRYCSTLTVLLGDQGRCAMQSHSIDANAN